ncbi:hypothetical protein [Burkholderia sp. Ac-20344]|nr:hypothetical protein [Burkholderia sp. Ac-20344]
MTGLPRLLDVIAAHAVAPAAMGRTARKLRWPAVRKHVMRVNDR